MELRHLQYFLTVAQFGTVGRAAKQLNVSQPAISKSISRLECTLNTRLFDRTARGMVLTKFGLSLAEHARNISNETRLIKEDFDALRGSGQGMLSIGTGASHGATIVPMAALAVSSTRPSARLSLTVGSSETLLPALQRGAIDILVGTVFERAWERELTSELIAHDRVVVVARQRHPLVRRGPVSVDQIASAGWVLGNGDDSLRGELNSLFLERGVTGPEPKFISTSVTSIKALLALSDLLAFLPESLLASELSSGAFRIVDIDGFAWRRPVHVLHLQHKPLTRLGSALVRQLRKAAQETPGYIFP